MLIWEGRKIPTIDDLDLEAKTVFIRCEFNVPVSSEGIVEDDTRILAALPTIQYALQHGAKVVIGSHRGRPWGERKAEFSMLPVSQQLGNILHKEVYFVNDCIGNERNRLLKEMGKNDIVFLENIRYYIEENKNEADFARALSEEVNVYIDDAFGNLHRPHASMAGMPYYVEEVGFGLLVKKELEVLGKAISNPNRPAVLILGGAKVSGKDGKVGIIENLIGKVDSILLGGKIAYHFLDAQGINVGETLVDRRGIDSPDSSLEADRLAAKHMLEAAQRTETTIVLPIDSRVGDDFSTGCSVQIVDNHSFPPGWIAMDIGPETVEQFSHYITAASTVIWNGPMGVFEFDPFRQGTYEVARILTNSSGFSIIGGGDTVTAVNDLGLSSGIDHISTGGGAMLGILMGQRLPGVSAVIDALEQRGT